ncbi:2,3-diketo-5-methylthiopentyl-1-phosphate enolase [bacterium HR33]|nr:2,3-diketo-5-methylthiopentyl-1-phosphate enolase [bacterium HR33]
MAEFGDRILAVYEFAASDRAAARRFAKQIAVEQTVEMPLSAVPGPVRQAVVGRIEELEPAGSRRWRAVISYEPELATELPALLNLLFGNVSMMSGVRLADFELPPALLRTFTGPAFGIEGIRRLSGAHRRPLLCSAIKPVGLSAEQLADLAYRFARAGVDIVKDDHGLGEQSYAAFADRVERCSEAVRKANRETGRNALYFPNLTGSLAAVEERLEKVRAAGCRGVLLAPMLVGLDWFQTFAARGEVAILAHPSFSGAYMQRSHGIAPQALLGKLFRLLGSDGVIFANAGGRFPVSQASCDAIALNLRVPWGDLRPAFPVAGGGVDARRADYWIERYGTDLVLLVSSSLYARRDFERAAFELAERVRRYE